MMGSLISGVVAIIVLAALGAYKPGKSIFD
jgi:hypothetical protein